MEDADEEARFPRRTPEEVKTLIWKAFEDEDAYGQSHQWVSNDFLPRMRSRFPDWKIAAFFEEAEDSLYVEDWDVSEKEQG